VKQTGREGHIQSVPRLRLSLSSIIPRWERLVAAKQIQGSHWIKVIITHTSCNKYSLLNICGFLKASPRKNFSFKLVRSAKNVADPWLKGFATAFLLIAFHDYYSIFNWLSYWRDLLWTCERYAIMKNLKIAREKQLIKTCAKQQLKNILAKIKAVEDPSEKNLWASLVKINLCHKLVACILAL